MKKSEDRKLLPISRLFPNMITLTSICMGMSSIRYSLDEKWELAVTLILIAAFLDVMDGRIARLLKATSNFGAHLDSLADMINFGIAPILTLYFWKLRFIEVKGLGWAIVLFYSICCAIRLARFNSDLDVEDQPIWVDKFFVGVPSTVGAFLVLAPMMVSFESSFYFSPAFLGLYATIIALLMASRVPTFSSKKIVIKRHFATFSLAVAGLIIASAIIKPWIALPILAIGYVITVPISLVVFLKKYK